MTLRELDESITNRWDAGRKRFVVTDSDRYGSRVISHHRSFTAAQKVAYKSCQDDRYRVWVWDAYMADTGGYRLDR